MQTPGRSARTLSWVTGSWVLGFPLVWSVGTRILSFIFDVGFGIGLPVPYILDLSLRSVVSFVFLAAIAIALSMPRGRRPPYWDKGDGLDYPLRLRPVGVLGFVLYGALLLLPYVVGDWLLGWVWLLWRRRQRRHMAGPDRTEDEELEELGILR